MTCSRPNLSQLTLSKDRSIWPRVHSSGESGCVLESDCRTHTECRQFRGRTALVSHAQGDLVEDASGTTGTAAFELLGELLLPVPSCKVGGMVGFRRQPCANQRLLWSQTLRVSSARRGSSVNHCKIGRPSMLLSTEGQVRILASARSAAVSFSWTWSAFGSFVSFPICSSFAIGQG